MNVTRKLLLFNGRVAFSQHQRIKLTITMITLQLKNSSLLSWGLMRSKRETNQMQLMQDSKDV